MVHKGEDAAAAPFAPSKAQLSALLNPRKRRRHNKPRRATIAPHTADPSLDAPADDPATAYQRLLDVYASKPRPVQQERKADDEEESEDEEQEEQEDQEEKTHEADDAHAIGDGVSDDDSSPAQPIDDADDTDSHPTHIPSPVDDAKGQDEDDEDEEAVFEEDEGRLDSDSDSVDDSADPPTATSLSSSPSAPHPDLLSPDPFVSRFSHHRVLPASVLSDLSTPAPSLTPLPHFHALKEHVFGVNLHLLAPLPTPSASSAESFLSLPSPSSPLSLSSLHVRAKLLPAWRLLAEKQRARLSASASPPESAALGDDLPHPVHRWLVPLLSSYRDVVWGGVTLGMRAAVVEAYCLHAANHVWKSRERVTRHSEKLRDHERRDLARQEAAREQRRLLKAAHPRKSHGRLPSTPLPPPSPAPEYRDQGFTRCKVLILQPFANAAFVTVSTLLSLLPHPPSAVRHHGRFLAEFAPAAGQSPDAGKPADYRAQFAGQLNDAFRIGLAIAHNAVTLYAPFYASDIVVASPLGLRMIVQEDCDWLSSVELVIVDGADVLAMQNWQHVDVLWPYLNRMVTGTGDGYKSVDFSRVREYVLQGQAGMFRQTVLLSGYLTQDMLSMIHDQRGFLRNYAGLVLLRPEYRGELSRVVLGGESSQRRLMFQRFSCGFLTQHEDRFNYFTTTLFPQLKATLEHEGHVLIFIPSYLDFIKIRNHFRAKHYSYAAISEYSKTSEMSRNRSHFYHRRVKFLLVSERFHFFRRYRIRGVRHVVFYSCPINAHFYGEVVGWMEGEGKEASGEGEDAVSTSRGTSVTLFCEWDGRELERVVGTQRAMRMIEGQQSTYMFC